MNEEIILDELRKMLFTTQQANECGLSNNDFKEDIQILFGAIELIENLIQRNKDLEQIEKEHKEENGRLREELENIEYIKRNFDYCLEQKIKEGIELKVKEKIEELDKKEKKELKGTKSQDRYDIKLEYQYKRNILQELLEEK